MDEEIVLTSGRAEPSSQPSDEQPHPVAVLWVPDVGATHWWREYYVYAPKRGARPLGFGGKR